MSDMIKTEVSKYVRNNITGGFKVTEAFSLSTKLSFHFLTSGCASHIFLAGKFPLDFHWWIFTSDDRME